jgi:hypothetical protein
MYLSLVIVTSLFSPPCSFHLALTWTALSFFFFSEIQGSYRGPVAQEEHGLPWVCRFVGHHEGTRRVFGIKRGVVRAGRALLG